MPKREKPEVWTDPYGRTYKLIDRWVTTPWAGKIIKKVYRRWDPETQTFPRVKRGPDTECSCKP
jgi:hypothetical protein